MTKETEVITSEKDKLIAFAENPTPPVAKQGILQRMLGLHPVWKWIVLLVLLVFSFLLGYNQHHHHKQGKGCLPCNAIRYHFDYCASGLKSRNSWSMIDIPKCRNGVCCGSGGMDYCVCAHGTSYSRGTNSSHSPVRRGLMSEIGDGFLDLAEN